MGIYQFIAPKGVWKLQAGNFSLYMSKDKVDYDSRVSEHKLKNNPQKVFLMVNEFNL